MVPREIEEINAEISRLQKRKRQVMNDWNSTKQLHPDLFKQPIKLDQRKDDQRRGNNADRIENAVKNENRSIKCG